MRVIEVHHHSLSPEEVSDKLHYRRPEIPMDWEEVAEVGARSIRGGPIRCLGSAQMLAMLQPEGPLAEVLAQVAVYSRAIFELAVPPKRSARVTVHLGPEVVTLNSMGGAWGAASSSAWEDGFAAAAAARDRDALDSLCRYPWTNFAQNKETKTEPYHHHLVHALQGYWTRAADAPDRLRRALELTDPSAFDPNVPDLDDHTDWTLDIEVPRMEVLLYLMLQDEPGFNAALAKALELHKGYWGSDKSDWSGKPRRNDTSGWLALELLGLACLAHDVGMAVDVTSGYIPRSVIEHGNRDLGIPPRGAGGTAPATDASVLQAELDGHLGDDAGLATIVRHEDLSDERDETEDFLEFKEGGYRVRAQLQLGALSGSGGPGGGGDLGGWVRVIVAPTVTPDEIRRHAEEVKRLLKYRGVLGSLRDLRSRVYDRLRVVCGGGSAPSNDPRPAAIRRLLYRVDLRGYALDADLDPKDFALHERVSPAMTQARELMPPAELTDTEARVAWFDALLRNLESEVDAVLDGQDDGP